MICLCNSTIDHKEWIFIWRSTQIHYRMIDCKKCFRYSLEERKATKTEIQNNEKGV